AVAADIEPAVSAGPDAGIFMCAPVDQIVPAFAAGARVIGNFVGWQAMRGADLLRRVVEDACGVLVRRLELAGGVERRERRLRLDRELIERHVLAGFSQRAAQFARPLVRCLPRPRVNQIERIAVENRARDAHRIERFARGMSAAERRQRRIVERLDAERYAIDTGGAITAKTLCLDAGRIGLKRDLGHGGTLPMTRN